MPAGAEVHSLADHVAAILGLAQTPAIVATTNRSERWQDQGFTVCRTVSDYRFDNGVQIRRTVEQDDFPDALACAECWIEYTVLADAGQPLQPVRKSFDNACREAFWLAYHRA
ncbi:hypothetical protein [Jeongeupia chitinilytica]|uniref:Uncharacterized protein n=1 Tax=Jeongeupia chitinilytica TaxID=1041641 RepID=A0ABQ3H0V2_9NEIS|nr:hypothetical protein [Jeongeupia chitinilytica]GHD64697.1 hypothetical protein GCM10007350_24300 [Jeongeupia chitinilytica]